MSQWRLGKLLRCEAEFKQKKATIAYAKFSGHLLSSKQLELSTKMHYVAAVVDSTLLHGGELWTELSHAASRSIEAVHMRWLRKATMSFRGDAEDRVSDHDLRITYNVPSVWSLLRCQRLRYLATFTKASPFLRALFCSIRVENLRG